MGNLGKPTGLLAESKSWWDEVAVLLQWYQRAADTTCSSAGDGIKDPSQAELYRLICAHISDILLYSEWLLSLSTESHYCIDDLSLFILEYGCFAKDFREFQHTKEGVEMWIAVSLQCISCELCWCIPAVHSTYMWKHIYESVRIKK